MGSPSIFVIVPVYNEAAAIKKLIEDLLQYDYRIIVVDDGSADETTNMINDQGVAVLRHAVNLGQGASLQTGMEFARISGADIVVHFDGDGQHQAADIGRLIEPVLKGDADIVFGSRFLQKETSKDIPFVRRFVLQTAR